MAVEKVTERLRSRFGVAVTKGGLVQVVHRTGDAAVPAYAVLGERIGSSAVVTRDERGWGVNRLRRYWLWVFTTPETTVYAVCDGRGCEHATAVLGFDFCSVVVSAAGRAPKCAADGLASDGRCRSVQGRARGSVRVEATRVRRNSSQDQPRRSKAVPPVGESQWRLVAGCASIRYSSHLVFSL